MALVINTNTSSLNAQRNLTNNSSAVKKSLQRLSSGLRINSASDDAAGLAISTGLTSQYNGLDQAVRNANDGLSLLGTAESAMTQQVNLLQRMRSLSVQSASDTNSGTNRASINAEVGQLKNEFDRIAQTTQFNGMNLLDGTFTSKDIQVGADSGVNQRISVDIDGTRSSSIGKSYKLDNTSAVGSTAASSGDIKIVANGTSYSVGATEADGLSTAQSDSSSIAFAAAINKIGGETGVTAKAESNTVTMTADQDHTAGAVAGQVDDGGIKINGVNIGAVTISSDSDTSVVDAINNVSSATGVTAALDSSNHVKLTAEDGRNIQVQATADATLSSGLATATTHGSIKMTSYKNSFTVTDASSRINLAGTSSLGTASVATLSVSDKDSANAAIDTIDGALEQLNSRLSGIGAQTNRLTSVSDNLSSAAENVASANSRILDADFASETSSLTKNQILQQAAVAILAQANQTPQLALSLLK